MLLSNLVTRIWILLYVMAGSQAALSPQELLNFRSPEHGNVIYLNDENFLHLLNGPRDYYISLLFTALDPNINCQQCEKFDPIYKRVSASYYVSNPTKHDIFFFIADFNDNKNSYGYLKMEQVPRLWVFPPSKDPSYNISSPHYPYTLGESAVNDILDFANFISKLASTNILIDSEFDPIQFGQYFFLTFFTVLLLKKKVLSKLKKSTISKYLSVISIIVLTSGYMFTVIRGIPFIAKDEKGEILYFSGGTHWQFGLETFIVSAIYIGLTFLFSGLVLYIPKVNDERKRFILVLSASIGVFCTFNYLTTIFLIKDPEYPYRLTSYF